MAYADLIATARDEEFAGRVSIELMKLAIDIANEADTTPNHANRLHLAQMHFAAKVNNKALAAAVIASNSTITNTINSAPNQRGKNVPDGDIEYAMGGLIEPFANAYSTIPLAS